MMKLSKPLLTSAKKMTLYSALICVSTSVLAVEKPLNASALHGLKIAVIKNAVGTDELVSGEYDKGFEKLTSASMSDGAAFETAMGLCVASIKLSRFEEANTACTEAINTIEMSDSSLGRGRHGKFLKSIAYSNRGIARYLADDNTAAMTDFTTALMLNDNAVVKNNATTLKASLKLDNEEYSAVGFAD